MWQAGRVGDSHRGGGEGKVLDGVGGWTAEGPARGTWFKCWLTSRDKELIELERDSYRQQEVKQTESREQKHKTTDTLIIAHAQD